MQSFEGPLIKTMSSMKRPSSYEFMFYPLTKGIARAIDNNHHIGLENLKLYVNSRTYREQLAVLSASSSIPSTLRTLSLLEMSAHGRGGYKAKDSAYDKAIVEDCKRMPNLYKLSIATYNQVPIWTQFFGKYYAKCTSNFGAGYW